MSVHQQLESSAVAMDQAKFKKIEDAVRIGGKGSVRRKHKRAPASTALEEKRLQTTLTKLSLFQMPGIEKMTLLMGDKTEIVIPGPKVQGSSGSNLLVVSGVATRVASAAKPSPPPPPMPALIVEVKPPKKPKKPRNRVRARNKRAQQLLDGGAGDAGSIGVLGAEGEGEGSDQARRTIARWAQDPWMMEAATTVATPRRPRCPLMAPTWIRPLWVTSTISI